MNNNAVNIDLKSLKFIVVKNKPYFLPAFIVLVSIILFFKFVIPQFGELFDAQKQAKEMQLKTKAFKENLDVLESINDKTLNSQVEILKLALPTKKDYIAVLNAVYLAAQRTGISLGRFSLVVGDLSEPENNEDFSTIKLTVPINSPPAAVHNFIQAINKTFPLVGIYSIKVGDESSSVDLGFHYKSLAVDSSKISQSNNSLSPISKEGLAVIDKLRKMEAESSLLDLLITPTGTPSAAIQ
jgi:hypothetical protein